MSSARNVCTGLLCALFISLSACSGSDNRSAEPEAQTPVRSVAQSHVPTTRTGCFMEVEKDALVVFAGWGNAAEQRVNREAIERFKAVCPAVSVEYHTLGDGGEGYVQRLFEAMEGGRGPDAFYVNDEVMSKLGMTGKLMALDPLMEEAGVSRRDFFPSMLSIFTIERKTYALPKDWGGLGLFYLPEAFKAAGIEEPTPFWTWDDLQYAARAIANTGRYAGFCQGADALRFAVWVFGQGINYTDEDFTTSYVDRPLAVEAAEYIRKMHEDGTLTMPDELGVGWCGEAIGRELVGMTFEGSWVGNYLRGEFPEVCWRVQELPAGPAGKAGIIFTNGIGVRADTKYPRASAALTFYLTGPENLREIVRARFAYSPHPDQLDEIDNLNDAAIVSSGTFDLSHVAHWGPRRGEITRTVGDALKSILQGEQETAEALREADRRVQRLLDEGNTVSRVQ